MQAAELPSSNGIGTARALARMYAALIGEVDGVRLLTPEKLASATEEQAGGKDRVMVIPSRFSSGYMLPTDDNPMTGPNAFGHTGRGGSLALADPEHGIAFGYVMNHIVSGSDDARAASLTEAVRKVLDRHGGAPGSAGALKAPRLGISGTRIWSGGLGSHSAGA